MRRKAREWWVVANQGGTGSLEPRLFGRDMVLADFDHEEDAVEHAEWADKEWPDLAPHRAIKVREILPKRRKRK